MSDPKQRRIYELEALVVRLKLQIQHLEDELADTRARTDR